jgi:hypothetical protein
MYKYIYILYLCNSPFLSIYGTRQMAPLTYPSSR